MSLQTYKDLIVWQRSRELTKSVYELCAQLPKDETFGLASQLKRAVVSIASNIAEGYLRNNRKEYVHFLGIALGSAAEVETQLILVHDLFGLSVDSELSKITEIQKMLMGIIKKLTPVP